MAEANATDEQLAGWLQRGDHAALAALVDRHYDPLMGYLYRMTRGDRALAQDLAQETFLRALRGIDSYQQARPFKAWLYAIATNLVRNHYNAADTRRTDNPAEEQDFANGEAAEPDAALIAEAEAQAVIAALDTLPHAQREVIILTFYQSLSQQAIADALEIPLGTVKSRLFNGVKRLRERMEARDVPER